MCPKLQHTWNDNIREETIHTVRRISKGKEITISYADIETFESQRRHLKKSFDFDYAYELYSLPETARAINDNRQSEIKRLDELIGDGSRLLYDPDRCLKDVHTLLILLKVKNITDARLPKTYYDTFQIAIVHETGLKQKSLLKRCIKRDCVVKGIIAR